MTIGERLEEARKRRGISIREAAESTKVRGDYLLAMEENSMHKIPLPEIYKRGFLKNYARLLKLDPQKILTDYEAREIGRTGTHQPEIRGDRDQPESREVFGRMVLPDDEDEPTPAHSDRANREERSPEMRNQKPPKRPSLNLADNTLYLKIGAGVAAVAILTVLIVVLVGLLRGSDPAPLDASVAGSGTALNPLPAPIPTGSTSNTATNAGSVSSRSITIRAQDSVTLIIDQVDPAERLYQGTLSAGDVISIEKQGAASIRFSNGAALTIEQANGRIIRPAQSAIGRIVVP